MSPTECVTIPRYLSPAPSTFSAKSICDAVVIPSTPFTIAQDAAPGAFYDVDLASSLDRVDAEGFERWGNLDNMLASGTCQVDLQAEAGLQTEQVTFGDCQPLAKSPEKPFQRWVSTLRRRGLRRQETAGLGGRASRPTPPESPSKYRTRHHRKSSTGSSTAFVTGVRSASISLSSVNLLPRSRRHALRYSKRHSSSGRSTRTSISRVRPSIDSAYMDGRSDIDPAITERSLQRRRILEELISTEEGYIGDVRFLMNVSLPIRWVSFLDSIRTKS